MNSAWLERIVQKVGIENLPEILVNELSASDFQSLLLEVFARRVQLLSPASILKAYENNRFVKPANIDSIDFYEFEIQLLKHAQKYDFEAIELSPVSPLGTCAVFGTVHQHKVLSALRGTEVVADATNVMALEIAFRKKQKSESNSIFKLCTSHRHTRTQIFDFKGFTPHFNIFCLATAGLDKGSFMFELLHVEEHIHLYLEYLTGILDIDEEILKIKLKWWSGKEQIENLQSHLMDNIRMRWKKVGIENQPILPSENSENYYQTVNFKIYWRRENQEIDIADGGLVDWTQQLLSNQKERMLISGLGTEMLYKLYHDLI
jgi:hypothetical protein